MQVEVEIEQDNVRLRPKDSEVERLWADNSKAARILGWTPEYAGLEGFKRGLQKTAAWFVQPGNLQLYKSDQYNI